MDKENIRMNDKDRCPVCGSEEERPKHYDSIWCCSDVVEIAIERGEKIDKARAILQTPNKYFEEMETDLYELFGL